jgi:CRP-like cAMP-binding protein
VIDGVLEVKCDKHPEIYTTGNWIQEAILLGGGYEVNRPNSVYALEDSLVIELSREKFRQMRIFFVLLNLQKDIHLIQKELRKSFRTKK